MREHQSSEGRASVMMRVLVVDDDLSIRELIAFALGLAPDIEAAMASSCEEALAVLSGHPAPDAMLMDVMMPGKDGIEFLRELRNAPEFRCLPTILMSAATRRLAAIDMNVLGVCGTIAKPFDPMTLAMQVKALIIASSEKPNPKG